MAGKLLVTLYSFVVAVAFGVQAHARTIVVPPGAVPEHADTEVSTNMPFVVDGERTREIKMRFALDGCMSNCVQVAFGKDADGDGVLGADEAETLYGWRNGRYFAESVTEGLRVEEADSGNVDSRVFAANAERNVGRHLRVGIRRHRLRRYDNRAGEGRSCQHRKYQC